jgi:predicted nucleic acid-binding protein
MRVFFDTSAFVKRYVEEPGSDEVQALLGDAEQIVVSVLCLPECASALRRLLREGRLTADEYRWLKEAILIDLAASDVCHLLPAVIDASVECLLVRSI